MWNVVDEAGALSSFFLSHFSNTIHFAFAFPMLINPSVTFSPFLYFSLSLHLYLLSTTYFSSSFMLDVVEVRAVPDNDMLVISENELSALKNLMWSEAGNCVVAVQLLDHFQ